jgi:CRP-like cAMP-binding protein
MSATLTTLSGQAGLPPQKFVYHDYPSRTLGKGESLYQMGDERESIFRVEEGLLKQSFDLVTGRERIVSVVGPGDFVGAITFCHSGGYADSVTALSPNARVTVIPAEHIGLDPQLKDDVFTATGVHLKRAHEAIEDGELPTPARLAKALLRLGARFGQTTDDGRVLLKLPLTHDNLAALIGAARETTTALLGEMRAGGVISGTRGQYSFDPLELNDFALERSFF